MLLEFFTNPVLRAPTLGSMLMCFSSGLIGCLVFLQKRSLVGEALSHASYPGIVLSILFTALFFPFSEQSASISILIGAFLSGLLGLLVIDQLEKSLKVSSDAALCFVLSLFFGIGVLIASGLQVSHALWFRQIQTYLFGQAATMVDSHIFLYGGLALLVLIAFILFFRFFEILHFDPQFAKTVGMPTRLIDGAIYFFLVLAIVVGMRSVGVVLMSGMLIAPAAAARQWTQTLSSFFTLSAFIGIVSAFFGNALSVWIPLWVKQPGLSLPTGPMIVLVAASICFFSLLFAPKRGLITRILRIYRFEFRCKQENALKSLYNREGISISFLQKHSMQFKGWLKEGKLTKKGIKEAEKLIRLHQLWEVYLIYMGQGRDRVHESAEEMEHVLTEEIERHLHHLLDEGEKK